MAASMVTQPGHCRPRLNPHRETAHPWNVSEKGPSIKGLTTWHYGAPVSYVDSVGGTGTVCMCSVVISGKTAISDSVSDSSCGAADI